MRRISSFIAMIVLAAICSGGRVAALEKQRGGAPGSSSAPIKTMGAGKDKTDLDVFGFTSVGDVNRIPVGKVDWPLRLPGYNIIRTFTNKNNKRILFLLNSNTGEAETFELNDDGSVGKSPWWTAQNPLPFLRCTNADIIQTRSEIKLITQDSFTGMVRVCTLNDDGSPKAGYTENILTDMQDKNLFQVYYHSSAGYKMIGVDTWTGKAVAYSLDMRKSGEGSWTRGWTSMDSLYYFGVRFRLLYKAAGDPYKLPSETADQIGRFQVQAVESNGVDFQTVQDIQVDGNYSSVRFVEFPSPEGASSYGVLFYNRTTGEYTLYDFNWLTGIDKIIDSGAFFEPDLKPAPPYIDLQPCVVNGKTFLGFVNADNAKPVGYNQANQMAQTIYDTMENTTVGYQFILAQSGRMIHRRAWGKLRLDQDPSLDTNMTTHTQLETGSVSKMITAMTVLKLADQGQIKLTDPIANHLAPGQAMPGTWAYFTPVRSLLTHTTGVSSNSCTLKASDGTVDCSSFFLKAPTNCGIDPSGNYNCDRSYNGSNFRAARKIIEYVTTTPNSKTETSKDVTEKTHELWAKDIGLDKITCQMNTGAYYYGPCPDPNGSAGCIKDDNNKWWTRAQQTDVDQNNWLPACSSRHWYASSRELMAFLGAIRYGQILKNYVLTDLLLSTDLFDLSGVAGSTALSWEPPTTLNNGTLLGKSGNLPLANEAARAYIGRLPYNCDVVVQLNTKSNDKVPTLVKDAFEAAVP